MSIRKLHYVNICDNFLTLPINTASCERSFCDLRQFKTYLRIYNERLSNLVLLYTHERHPTDFQIIIDRFLLSSGNKRTISITVK